MLLVVIAGIVCSGKVSAEGQNQIADMVHSFEMVVSQRGDPSPFLSPTVTGKRRDKELDLARGAYATFSISGFSFERDLAFTDAQHATLKASVAWQTSHLQQSADTSIHFEKVGQNWYFSDFDFLEFNWARTILMSLVGVFYALIALSLYFHWRKRTFPSGISKYTWGVLILTPVGWVLYPLLKPWQGRGETKVA